MDASLIKEQLVFNQLLFVLDACEIDLEAREDEGPKILFSYRGRGESKGGFALVGTREDFARFLVELGAVSADQDDDYLLEMEWQHWAQDQLGHDLVFYWPRIQIQKPEGP